MNTSHSSHSGAPAGLEGVSFKGKKWRQSSMEQKPRSPVGDLGPWARCKSSFIHHLPQQRLPLLPFPEPDEDAPDGND